VYPGNGSKIAEIALQHGAILGTSMTALQSDLLKHEGLPDLGRAALSNQVFYHTIQYLE